MSEIIRYLPGAILRTYWNELALDEQIGANDPVKFRLGGRLTGSGYIGTFSGDVLEGGDAEPTRREKMFMAYKMDPDPMIEFYIQRPNTQDDANMIRVLTLTSGKAEFHVPVKGIDRLTAPNGAYEAVIQNDSNFVIYAMNPLRAVWSWLTGRL